MDKSEKELVGSALRGDVDCFGELCKAYYGPLVAVAYSLLADHHLAEDAAQEVFARALRNLPQLKDAGRFGFWLCGICRNVARDMAREKSRLVSTDDLSRLSAAAEPQDDALFVKEALNKLSESERELIVLRYYNSFSQERISSVLGITKAAVNSRLSRAKRRLAKYLRRCGLDVVQS